MDQPFCTTCGHRLEAGDRFCTACGARVVPSAAAAPPAPTPDPTPPMIRPAPARPPARPQRPRRGRRGSRLRFWGWVAAAALFVAAISYGLGSLTRHDDRPQADPAAPGVPTASSSPRRSPSPEASVDPQALAQARALYTLITQSATDKQRIAAAAAQLQRCDHVAQAIATFEAAAASREQLVDQAAGLEVGLLPGGGAAIADLSEALRAAADADRAYVSWGETRHLVTIEVGPPPGRGHHGHHVRHGRPQKQQHRRVCRGAPRLEAQAVRLSAASHGAKQETARAWNIVAAQFGLPTITWTEL